MSRVQKKSVGDHDRLHFSQIYAVFRDPFRPLLAFWDPLQPFPLLYIPLWPLISPL